MKKSMKKLIEVLLSLALVAQFAVPMTALADGEETTSASYSVDFSSTVSLDRDGAYEGVFQQYLKGQYGKGKDDTSLRVYTLGKKPAYNNAYTLTNYFPTAVVAEEGKVGHISFEYLLEDANSAIEVYVADKVKGGAVTAQKRVLQIQPSYINQVYMFSATGSYRVGTWAQADIYFEYGKTGATIFHNGTKYTAADADLSAFAQINAFDIKHVHTANGEIVNPSAIQFDNFVCETVDSIPEAQADYRYLGEMFNFDDGFTHSLTTSESNSTSKYMIANNDKAIPRVNWTGTPSVQFNGTGNYVFFEKGVGGNPAWDTSFHGYNSSSFGRGMKYIPGINDLQAGDYAHLTFKIMDNSDQYRNSIVSNFFNNGDTVSMKFEDGSELMEHPFFGFKDNGSGVKYYQFLKTTTDVKAEQGKWHKIDIVFKVGNGEDEYTKADCYVDGQLISGDVELYPAEGNYSVLKNIGQVGFALSTGTNIYVDDFGFGVFTAETLHNPTEGYTLSATDDVLLNSCINNTTREIAISEGYKVEYFLDGIDQKDNVAVYNADGLLVTEGPMEGCSVKVSNGFGGGIWYNLVDTMVVAEDNFTKRLDGNMTTNVFGSIYDVGVSRDGVGGLGGKAADDLALELDEAKVRDGAKDHVGRPNFKSFTKWKSQTVILEGSFMLKNADSSLELTIAPNDLEYGGNAQYLMQFGSNGMMRSMYRNTLAEQWQPNRWYKIAAVMNYHSKTIQVYLNGDIIWDGPYTTLDADGEAVFGEGGSGFAHLSQIRVTFTGQAAMDNIRVSYGQCDPAADKITIEPIEGFEEFFSVNNEENIIGVAALGQEGINGDLLSECFYDESNTMKVYADSTLATEVTSADLTANSIAVVSKGEVLKYYEMGYVTNKLLRPTISFAGGTLTATSKIESSASKNADSTAVLLLAVYNGNQLETVNLTPVTSVTGLTEDVTTNLTGIDMTGKVAKAFLWDGTGTMKPLGGAREYPDPDEVPAE